MVSEDCFNQELLKIKSEVPTFIMRGKTKQFYIDDYTIRVGPSNPSSGDISLNVTFTYFFYIIFFRFNLFIK